MVLAIAWRPHSVRLPHACFLSTTYTSCGSGGIPRDSVVKRKCIKSLFRAASDSRKYDVIVLLCFV